MIASLLRWWPALPALTILWFGGVSFVGKYPRMAHGPKGRAATHQGSDSLLVGFRRELAEDKASSAGDTLAAAARSENPFRPIRAPRPAGEPRPGGMSVPPPPRNYHLKGTVGTNVATITNNSGQKLILKVGDPVDSATVVSIETNKVVLKDRAGKFELLLEN